MHSRSCSRAVKGFFSLAFVLMSITTVFADTATYVYDDMNRLLRVQFGDGSAITYTYDEIGNRTVKTTSATCPNSPVLIQGRSGGYDALQDAYNAASNDTIQSRAWDFIGDLSLNINKVVTFNGGYDCPYSTIVGKTVVHGTLRITDGSATIGNVIVQE